MRLLGSKRGSIQHAVPNQQDIRAGVEKPKTADSLFNGTSAYTETRLILPGSKSAQRTRGGAEERAVEAGDVDGRV